MSRNWSAFVEKLNALVEKDPDRNEAETKAKIVEPVLTELGWDFLGDDVELEYPVDFATTKTKVDYALKQNERPIVFVEAKALKSEVSYKNIKQALDYSTHEDVRWCVVTNGRDWQIFDADKYNNRKQEIKATDARVEKISLENFDKRKESLEIISRGSIESGDTAKRVKSIWQTQETIEELRNEKEILQRKIAEILKRASGDLLHEKLESLAAQFINDTISELEGFVARERENVPEQDGEIDQDWIELDPQNLEYQGRQDLTHTKVDGGFYGEIDDIKSWKNLINSAIRQTVGARKRELVLEIIPNAHDGLKEDNPNRYLVDETNISIIPMDANHCAQYAASLADETKFTYRIEFHWRDKEKALYPGENGVIESESQPENNGKRQI